MVQVLRAARMPVYSLIPNLPNEDDADDATGGGDESAAKAAGDVLSGSSAGDITVAGSTGIGAVGSSLLNKEAQQHDEIDELINSETGPLNDNDFMLQERDKPHDS